MRLNKLSLRDFRNYREATVDLDPGVNLIVGDNAQGKTNLLEAVSYLGSGRSFRAQKNSEMIRFGAEFGEIYGEVHSQDRDQTLRWLLFPGRRQIFRNGAKKRTAGELSGASRQYGRQAEALGKLVCTALRSLARKPMHATHQQKVFKRRQVWRDRRFLRRNADDALDRRRL